MRKALKKIGGWDWDAKESNYKEFHTYWIYTEASGNPAIVYFESRSDYDWYMATGEISNLSGQIIVSTSGVALTIPKGVDIGSYAPNIRFPRISIPEV